MKKIVLSLLILSMAVAVNAQEGKHRGDRKMKHRHGMMTEKLNLSDEQKTKMKTLNEDFQKKMSELKKNENITVKDWKAQMETLRKDHKSNISSVLTSEQKAQMEKMKTERKMMHKADGKARMEKMKTSLGLTDEQVAKMETNRKEMGEKMKAIRENKSLDEAKKKEQFKALQKEQKEKMKSILTEDQIKKLEEGRKARPERKQKSI